MRNVARQIVVPLAAILAATAAATACSDPTAPVAAPEARFDGGITFGSGNFAGTGENVTAADSVSTARGGIGFGSGN